MSNRTTDVVEKVPTAALKDAGMRLLGLVVDKAVEKVTDRVGDLADRLTDVAENGGTGITEALGVDGGGGKAKALVGGALGGLKGAVTGAVKGAFGGAGRGSGKKLKVTVISEDIDVGLPLRTTYNLWTQYEDFPNFMKKVEKVSHESDEKTHWQAKVFWSRREWDATIVEQVPDSHIVWRSKGQKGHVDGAVTFTELGTNLTRVMLMLEYWPQGLFERTGNLWRAQGRRARLELQHFRRHAMTHALLEQDEIEGWRGEVRDGEVVMTLEDGLAQEARGEDAKADDTEPEDTEADDTEPEDTEADEADELEDYEDAEDEPADEPEDEPEEDADETGAADDAADEYEDDYYEDERDDEAQDEPEDQDEPEVAARNGRSRRAPARKGG